MADNVVFNGTERQLNFNSGGLDGITGFQSGPALAALTGGGYIVAYAANAGGNNDIYYQRLNADGTVTGHTESTFLSGDQLAASVAGRADGGFVGVYQSSFVGAVNLRQIVLDDFAVGAIPTATAIDTSSSAAGTPAFNFFDPDVARLANGLFLVVYEAQENATGNFDIKFNTYNPTTGVAGTAAFLTTTGTVNEFDPEVAANASGNTALVVYVEDGPSGDDIKARLFNSTVGTFSPTTLTVADSPINDFDNPDVAALTDGRYVIVWEEQGTLVNGRIFDPAIGTFGPIFLVNGTTGDQNNPKVTALPGGRFVVVWEEGGAFAGDVETNAVLARRFSADGAPDGDVFLVNTSKVRNQGDPAIASQPDGRFQIAWEDSSRQNTTDLSDSGIKGQTLRLPDTAGVRGETTNGTAGADILRGYALHETFNAFGGDDIIFAGGGHDTVNGGSGFDVIRGENGDDLLRGGSGDDVVFGASGNDQLFGEAGDDRLFGDARDDRLFGGAGNDVQDGGTGNDMLDGGLGRDILKGGAGADRFDFNAIAESRRGEQHDTVFFSRSQRDKIDLRTIDADTDGTAGNQAFRFIGGAAFSGVDGQLRFSGGLLQGDTNGDRVADFEVRIVGALVAGDVLL
jgi:Ca2+-binding RTX toxin-like protein